MDDDDIGFGIMPWCESKDYQSAVNINLRQPLFTIKEALRDSILRTLDFSPVFAAAEAVSVEGPVTVDNIDQHVMARSEIILPREREKSVFGEPNLNEEQQSSYDNPCERKCRDLRGDGEIRGSENDDDDDDDDIDEEDDEEEDDDEDEDEEDDEDEDCDDEENGNDPCINYNSKCRPCRDPPQDNSENNSSQRQQGYCRDIRRDAELRRSEICEERKVEKAQEMNENNTTHEEVKIKESTQEEKALDDLHEECLYLSKEELQTICKKYKLYDKKAKVKRSKSGSNIPCETEQEKSEEISKEKGGYVCKESEEEDEDIDEDDEDCEEEEEEEEQQVEKVEKVAKKENKDECKDEEEDYEEEEAEPYFGLERPCKAAPIIEDLTEKKAEPPLEISRDYTRYDTCDKFGKSEDIFYKIDQKSSRSSSLEKVSGGNSKIENKISKSQTDKKVSSLSNLKIMNAGDILYYDDSLKKKIKTKTSKKTVKVVEDKKKEKIEEEEAYFGSPPKEMTKVVKVKKPKQLCITDVYFNSNGNNNNIVDADDDEEGDYYEHNEEGKNIDVSEKCDYTDSRGSGDYTSYLSTERIDKKYETTDSNSQYRSRDGCVKFNGSNEIVKLDGERCKENAGLCEAGECGFNKDSDNQKKYMAYGHSGEDDEDSEYFANASLISNEEIKTDENVKTVSCDQQDVEPIIPYIEPNYLSTDPEEECFQPFASLGMTGSSIEPLSSKVTTLTSNHFEHCKRVFESMKQRAFGDDFEDYFESCTSTTNEDVSPSVADNKPSPNIQGQNLASSAASAPVLSEKQTDTKGGFLKSLFGIITKSGSKPNRKPHKTNVFREEVPKSIPSPVETKSVDKKYFSFGRYKTKSKEKAASPEEYLFVRRTRNKKEVKIDKPKFPFGKTFNEIEQETYDLEEVSEDVAVIDDPARDRAIQQVPIEHNEVEIKNSSYIFKSGKLLNKNRGDDDDDYEDDEVKSITHVLLTNSGDTEASVTKDTTLTSGCFSFSAYQAKKLAEEPDKTTTGFWKRNPQNKIIQDQNTELLNKRINEITKNSVQEEMNENNHEENTSEVFVGNTISLVSSCELPSRVRKLGDSEEITLTYSISEHRDKMDISCGNTIEPKDDFEINKTMATSECQHEFEKIHNRTSVTPLTDATQIISTVNAEHGVSLEDTGYNILPIVETNRTSERKLKCKVNPFYKVTKRSNSKCRDETGDVRFVSNGTDYPKIARNRSEKRERSKTPERSKSQEKRTIFNYGKNFRSNNVTSKTTIVEPVTPNLKSCAPIGKSVNNNRDESADLEECNAPANVWNCSHKEVLLDDARSSKKDVSTYIKRNITGRTPCLQNRVIDNKYRDSERKLNLFEKAQKSSSIARTSYCNKSRLRKVYPKSDLVSHERETPMRSDKIKTCYQSRPFVQGKIIDNATTSREIFSKGKAIEMVMDVFDNENQNVNCGCDEEDSNNSKLQNVTSIIFTESQQPAPNICDIVNLSAGEGQGVVAHDDTASRIVMGSFHLGDAAETSITSNLVSYENPSLRVNPMFHLEPTMELPNSNAEINTQSVLEEIQNNSCLTAVSKADSRSRSYDKEMHNTEDVYSKKQCSNKEIFSHTPQEYTVRSSIGDHSSVIENYFDKNQTSITQQNYGDNSGKLQENNDSQRTSKSPSKDEYLIINSKIGNVIHHFDSGRRSRWKLAENDDILNITSDKTDTQNQGKYAKYNLLDDSSSSLFGESHMIKCANVNSLVQDSDPHEDSNVNDIHIFFGGPYPKPSGYAYSTSEEELVGGNYVDGFGEKGDKFKSPIDFVYTSVASGEAATSSMQHGDVSDKLSSPARSLWTTSPGHIGNEFAKMISNYSGSNALYSNSRNDGKSWENNEDNVGYKSDEMNDKGSWTSSVYTPAWKGVRPWKMAEAHVNSNTESDNDAVFWSNTSRSPTRTQERTRNVTDSQDNRGSDGVKDKDFWTNTIYSPARKDGKKWEMDDIPENAGEDSTKMDGMSNALYSPGGRDGKAWKMTSTLENKPEQMINKDFWTSNIYSPSGQDGTTWKMGETFDNINEEKKDNFWSSTVYSPACIDGLTSKIVDTIENKTKDTAETEDCWSTTLYPSTSNERMSWKTGDKTLDKITEEGKNIKENKALESKDPTVTKEKLTKKVGDVIKKTSEETKETKIKSTTLNSSVKKETKSLRKAVEKGIDEGKDVLSSKLSRNDDITLNVLDTKAEIVGWAKSSESPLSTNVNEARSSVQEKQRKIAARWKENMAGDTMKSVLHITKLSDLKEMQEEYLKTINAPTKRGGEEMKNIPAVEDKVQQPHRVRGNNTVTEKQLGDVRGKTTIRSPKVSNDVLGKQRHLPVSGINETVLKVESSMKAIEGSSKIEKISGEAGSHVATSPFTGAATVSRGRHRQGIVPAISASPQKVQQHNRVKDGNSRAEKAIYESGNKLKETSSPRVNTNSESRGRHGYTNASSQHVQDRKLEQANKSKEVNINKDKVAVETGIRLQEPTSIRVTSKHESGGRPSYIIGPALHASDRKLEQVAKTQEINSKREKKSGEKSHKIKQSSPRINDKFDNNEKQGYVIIPSTGRNMSVHSVQQQPYHTTDKTRKEELVAKETKEVSRVNKRYEASTGQGYVLIPAPGKSKSDYSIEKPCTVKENKTRKEKTSEAVSQGKEVTSPTRLHNINEYNARQGYTSKNAPDQSVEKTYKTKEDNNRKEKIRNEERKHISPKVDRRFEPNGRQDYMMRAAMDKNISEQKQQQTYTSNDRHFRQEQLTNEDGNKDIRSPNRLVNKSEIRNGQEYVFLAAMDKRNERDTNKETTDLQVGHHVRELTSPRSINRNELLNKKTGGAGVSKNNELGYEQHYIDKGNNIRKENSPNMKMKQMKEQTRVIRKNESIGRQTYPNAPVISTMYEQSTIPENNTKKEDIVDEKIKQLKESYRTINKYAPVNREAMGINSSLPRSDQNIEQLYKTSENRKEVVSGEQEWTLRSPRMNLPAPHLQDSQGHSRRISLSSDNKRQVGLVQQAEVDFKRDHGINNQSLAGENMTSEKSAYVNQSSVEYGNIKIKDGISSDNRVEQGFMKQNGMYRQTQNASKTRDSQEGGQSERGIVDTKQISKTQSNEKNLPPNDQSPKITAYEHAPVDEALSARNQHRQHITNVDGAQNKTTHFVQNNQVQTEEKKINMTEREQNNFREMKEFIDAYEKKEKEKRDIRDSITETSKKSTRVFRVDLGEGIRGIDRHTTGTANINKPKINKLDAKQSEEYEMSKRPYHSPQYNIKNDTAKLDNLKNIKETSVEKAQKQKPVRMFKIDYEEKFGEKARNKTKESIQKPKIVELDTKQSKYIEHTKVHESRPTTNLLARSVDKEKVNKNGPERYHYKQRLQKSDTRVTREFKQKVENSKSEINSHRETFERKQPASAEENKKWKLQASQRDENKKWKTEIHRKAIKTETDKSVNSERANPISFLEEHWKESYAPSKIATRHHHGDDGYSDGRVKTHADSQLTKQQAIGDNTSKNSNRDSNEHEHFMKSEIKNKLAISASSKNEQDRKRSSPNRETGPRNENAGFEIKRRPSEVKKSRTDTNQTERYNTTFIDNSVVDTVARAWMDDVGKTDTSFLKESKMFSPSVLIQHTSGSDAASTVYMNSPIAMIGNQEQSQQSSPKKVAGEYLEKFIRPTFLRSKNPQENDSSEDQASDCTNQLARHRFNSYLNTTENHNEDLSSQGEYADDKIITHKREEKKETAIESFKKNKFALERRIPEIESSTSRSYYNYMDTNKVNEVRKQMSKDDSVIHRRQNYDMNESSVRRAGDKQNVRQNRQSATSEKFNNVSEHQKRNQNSLAVLEERLQSKLKQDGNHKPHPHEKKGVDSKNTKSTRESSKDAKTISKKPKNAKATENQQGSKTIRDNSKEIKLASDSPNGKGHMFSYKVSSNGNRSEIVRSDAKLIESISRGEAEENTRPKRVTHMFTSVETGHDIPTQILNEAKEENIRREQIQEPPVQQLGLFARLLNSLTRSSNTTTITQVPETIKIEHKQEEMNKPGSGECTNEQTKTDSLSVGKDKAGSGNKNKSLRSRSPMMSAKDAKSLRPDYKQNMNCNADCDFHNWTKSEPVKSYVSDAQKRLQLGHTVPSRVDSVLSHEKTCIDSVAVAVQCNTIVVIVLFMLYVGTCFQGLLQHCLQCPIPSIYELVYNHGLIYLLIDAYVIKTFMSKRLWSFGMKEPPKCAAFYSFVCQTVHLVLNPLVYVVTVLYTCFNNLFLRAFYHSVAKATRNILILIFFFFNYAAQKVVINSISHTSYSTSGQDKIKRETNSLNNMNIMPPNMDNLPNKASLMY